ncbi:Uncharacterised protein [uncultured Avibacterium sp.]|uniref:LRAT domain-containing protein n=1 Tax=uncultured Avibacterium sp. TaxID=1936169 RepID=A0A486XCB9_9PAST|nr:Uncharacterised protein [uncultured Avibacterium sp.]
MLKKILSLSIITNLTESIIDNIFRHKVIPKFGSILYCDLAFGIIEHSGIYVGNNSVVHLNKYSEIEKVSLSDFIQGALAITIYVSSSNGKAIGSKKVGNFALSQVGKKTKYNVLLRNCHQFSSSCITGNLDNNDLLLSLLKITARKKLGVNEWRALAQ